MPNDHPRSVEALIAEFRSGAALSEQLNVPAADAMCLREWADQLEALLVSRKAERTSIVTQLAMFGVNIALGELADGSLKVYLSPEALVSRETDVIDTVSTNLRTGVRTEILEGK